MDVKSPVKDATSTAKQSVDSAAGQLQDVASQVTKVGGNVQKAVDKSLIGRIRHSSSWERWASCSELYGNRERSEVIL